MRFLADQDVYGLTVRFLRTLGHDVVTAYELRLSQAEDVALLRTAQADKRIFITRDKISEGSCSSQDWELVWYFFEFSRAPRMPHTRSCNVC